VWDELFLEHPRAVGETYFQHQRRAFGFAGQLINAGLACALHGVAPRLFARAASATVDRLHNEMSRRGRAPAPEPRVRVQYDA
jgi:hypothetical protein